MTVTFGGRVCRVVPYPISIEWPPRWLATLPDVKISRESVRARHGIGSNVCLGLGVERWDFTKGSSSASSPSKRCWTRIAALAAAHPLAGCGAHTQQTTSLSSVTDANLERGARINEKFGTASWKPIVLIDHHQEPREVFELFRAADFCIVNSSMTE